MTKEQFAAAKKLPNEPARRKTALERLLASAEAQRTEIAAPGRHGPGLRRQLLAELDECVGHAKALLAEVTS